MAGNHKRAAFLQGRWHGELDNAIQRIDNSLDAAAAIQIDDRVTGGHKDIAGTDHVRTAKEDQAVAIAVRRRLMKHHHWLIVEI